MNDLLAARIQMAVSLGFHIIFAEVGIAMPLMMVLAEWRWHRTGDIAYRELARRWARGTAILFGVGAVSGTVLSFELGLLWPGFMRQAGPIIGMPFSLEGFAFFAEAIFLGVYLYGWQKVGRRTHLIAGVIVAASGAASALFVVLVNAWMNAPVGFRVTATGQLTDIDPLMGMQSPSAVQQVIHMLLASYAATGMAVAGVHALLLLRGRAPLFHRRALTVALMVGAPAALLQPLSGDLSARVVAATQPIKLAAMEGQWETMRGAPLRIGGMPNQEREETRWSVEIPYALSLMAFHDPNALVQGLRSVPREDRPPVAVVHLAFQAMVALGSALALVALVVIVFVVRRRDFVRHRIVLVAMTLVMPFGFLATEAGWIVTEVGRQPWTVQGVIRTSDAVTPMPGLAVPMFGFILLYIALGAVVVALIASIVRETDVDMPDIPAVGTAELSVHQ